MNFKVSLIPALSDNYIFLIEGKNITVVVDPSEAEPVYKALGDKKLTHILNTHHHMDHSFANSLKSI